MKLIKDKRFDRILKFDEFLASKDKSFIFNLFYEGKIEFQPTYKFEMNQSSYDKNRIPAYCDRILCKTNLPHKFEEYNCLSDQNLSDHKPVILKINIQIEVFDQLIYKKLQQIIGQTILLIKPEVSRLPSKGECEINLKKDKIFKQML